MIHGNLAMTQFEKGAASAVDPLRASYENARTLNDDYSAASLGQQLAVALLRLDRMDEAAQVLAFVINVYREKGMRPALANALELSARLSDQAGRPEEAKRARDEAAELRAAAFPVPGPDLMQTEGHA